MAIAAETGGLGPAEIASIHSKLGLAVHELLAADWLARRYRVHWVMAMCALGGIVDVAKIPLNEVAKVERGLPTMVSNWVRAKRMDNDPRVKAAHKDLRGILRIRRDGTKALLRHVLSKKGVEWESWTEGWAEYERAARLLADAGAGHKIRRFSSRREFTTYANRVAKSLLTYRKRAEKGRGSR